MSRWCHAVDVSNHAHRRRTEPLPGYAERPGIVARIRRFLGWFFGPSDGADRFPRRGSATARMNAAVRAGSLRGSRRQR
jgi:hypothetical protein